MESIPLITHAWELHRAGARSKDIAVQIGKHRATVYRWFRGIRRLGIRIFLRRYEAAKKGRRQKRKTDPLIKARIYAIREEFHHCCGEKIRYWLQRRHGLTIGISTIYRILGEKYLLRSKWKKNTVRGPVPKAGKPREVIQHDTVDFGELFAFTSIDICTREAQVVMRPGLNATDGVVALHRQMAYFHFADLFQRDGGSEFKAAWNSEALRYCHRIRTARPYKKNEQAYIESFNRTLRKECLGWQTYRTRDLDRIQGLVDTFLIFYNTQRPHLSLRLQPPTTYLSHLR